MANESRRYGAQGGRKRAESLSDAERKAQASNAAVARWSKGLPKAVCGSADDPLIIGDIEIPAYVLEDGRRVLAQRGLQGGLGFSRSAGKGGARRIVAFLRGLEAKGLDIKDLAVRADQPFRFVMPRGGIADGYEAKILPDICAAIIAASQKGLLEERQQKIAIQAAQLQHGFAQKGIEAMVDIATGYDDYVRQTNIAKVIEQYVAKDLRQWVRTFPRSFFEMLCKLRGISLPEDMRLPRYFGHIINDLVWDRLAPGIRKELAVRNPAINGRRKHRHHQFMTEAVGHPRLLYHLGQLEGIGSGFQSGEWKRFHERVDARLQNYSDLPLFAGDKDPAELDDGAPIALPASSSASSEPETPPTAE